MKKRLRILGLLSMLTVTLAPSFAWAMGYNDVAMKGSIIVKDRNDRAGRREAYVLSTADQYYFLGTGMWESKMFNLTYRTIWFTNSIVQTGYDSRRIADYSPVSQVYRHSYKYRVR